MIVIFTRTNGVRIAINALAVITISPNGANTVQTIDTTAASFQVPGTLDAITEQFTRVFRAHVGGFFTMRTP